MNKSIQRLTTREIGHQTEETTEIEKGIQHKTFELDFQDNNHVLQFTRNENRKLELLRKCVLVSEIRKF